jgi:hypothetical protein
MKHLLEEKGTICTPSSLKAAASRFVYTQYLQHQQENTGIYHFPKGKGYLTGNIQMRVNSLFYVKKTSRLILHGSLYRQDIVHMLLI